MVRVAPSLRLGGFATRRGGGWHISVRSIAPGPWGLGAERATACSARFLSGSSMGRIQRLITHKPTDWCVVLPGMYAP